MSYHFGIVGCGRIAHRHAEQVEKHGVLAAACDIVPEKAAFFADRYKASPFFAIQDMLAKASIDIVIICSPNGLHAEHAIDCLSAHKHVLCEKPMCIRSTDATAMIRTADDSGRKLFVVKQNRYNPPVVFIRQLLMENKLGSIHSFQLNCFWNRDAEYYKTDWKGTLRLDGGTLFTQFSHFIDLLYWFLGDIKMVSGIRTNARHQDIIEFEDCGSVILQMKNGAIGTLNYTINSFEKNMEGSITLFGETGTVTIGGQYLNELKYFAVQGMQPPVFPSSRPANEYGTYTGSMSNHDLVYENMLKKLNDDSHDFVEAKEAAKTVEIIEKIYAASREV